MMAAIPQTGSLFLKSVAILLFVITKGLEEKSSTRCRNPVCYEEMKDLENLWLPHQAILVLKSSANIFMSRRLAHLVLDSRS